MHQRHDECSALQRRLTVASRGIDRELKEKLQRQTAIVRSLQRKLMMQIKKGNDFIDHIDAHIQNHRAYDPQQFAVVGYYNPDDEEHGRYFTTTQGLGPCVGVVICVHSPADAGVPKMAMVGHFDSTHYCASYNDGGVMKDTPDEEKATKLGQLHQYFVKILDKMDVNNGERVVVTIVQSSHEHSELDTEINKFCRDVLKNKYSQAHDKNNVTVETELVEVPAQSTSLVCDLKTGTVYTDYKDVELEGDKIFEALKLPHYFKLYHMKNGDLNEIDIINTDYIVQNNLMSVPEQGASKTRSPPPLSEIGERLDAGRAAGPRSSSGAGASSAPMLPGHSVAAAQSEQPIEDEGLGDGKKGEKHDDKRRRLDGQDKF